MKFNLFNKNKKANQLSNENKMLKSELREARKELAELVELIRQAQVEVNTLRNVTKSSRTAIRVYE
jgi:hypothetical protein